MEFCLFSCCCFFINLSRTLILSLSFYLCAFYGSLQRFFLCHYSLSLSLCLPMPFYSVLAFPCRFLSCSMELSILTATSLLDYCQVHPLSNKQTKRYYLCFCFISITNAALFQLFSKWPSAGHIQCSA